MRDLNTQELTHVYGGTGKSKCAPPPKKYKGCKPSRGGSSGGGRTRYGKGSSS